MAESGKPIELTNFVAVRRGCDRRVVFTGSFRLSGQVHSLFNSWQAWQTGLVIEHLRRRRRQIWHARLLACLIEVEDELKDIE